MIAVTSSPINRAVNGFDVAIRIASTALAPRCCNDEIIMSSAKRKMNNVPRM